MGKGSSYTGSGERNWGLQAGELTLKWAKKKGGKEVTRTPEKCKQRRQVGPWFQKVCQDQADFSIGLTTQTH